MNSSMDQFVTPLTLENLLHHCTDRSSPHWEHSWQEFIGRYKKAIYNQVVSYCSSWRLPRLKFQFSEVVDDIVNDVVYYLCRDDFKTLKSYREHDNEKRFLAWLASICNRRSGSYLRRFFIETLSDKNIDDLHDSIAGLDFDMRQELYETVVANLRLSSGKKSNTRREMFIFSC